MPEHRREEGDNTTKLLHMSKAAKDAKEFAQCRGVKEDEATTMRAIDIHCHIYPAKIASRAVESVGDFYQIPMDCANERGGTAEGLLEVCKTTPIERCVVYSVATRADQVPSINDFIAKTCEEHPELTGFMTLHQDFADPEAEIARAEAMGLRGIKLHPDTQQVDMDDPRLMRIYEIAEGRLPMVIHCGDYRYDYSHPRRMKRILQAFPNLVVDAAHFGGWSVFDLALEYLKDADCFFDMSSSLAMLGGERTKELCRIYGCDRILFGSDYPMWSPAEEFEIFTNLGFTESELEDMLYNNALRFLGER